MTVERTERIFNILNRYRSNAARAGYNVRDPRTGATNVQIPRRVYMGLSNG